MQKAISYQIPAPHGIIKVRHERKPGGGIKTDMNMRTAAAVIGLVLSGVNLSLAVSEEGKGSLTPKQKASPVVQQEIIVDKIWSAVSVGFCLLTSGDMQYVAYYNSERRTVVGMRKLSEPKFTLMTLPSIQGWDSHNYLTLAVDSEGCIHLSGNMHAVPLVYFRSQKPMDITTMTQVKSMVGTEENRCTYPKFMEGPDGALLFHYRDGASGGGDEIYNIYDVKAKIWKRFLDKSLTAGEGKRNAYQNGPRLGPDGWYHLLWVWRETSDAETNHDLSYARSRDLIHWENAAGEPLTLPITLASKGTVVDPVPEKGGIINGCHHFGFDSKNRVIVTYHKHDEKGNTQAYAARFDNGKWVTRAISSWDGRHIFKGGGSGPSQFGTSLSVQAIEQHGSGKLAVPFSHWKAGSGLLVIDEETLAPAGIDRKPQRFPSALGKAGSTFPGMGVRWCEDSGSAKDTANRYVLRWECLGSNRDKPRGGDLPENGYLVLYKIGYE